jgi:triosephosphate isomerase
MALRPLVAGNWKMNGLKASIGDLEKIIAGVCALADKSPQKAAAAEVMVCPPATLVASFAAAARGTPVTIGGQDCHALEAGAFTGDISAEMLRDAGARAVIVGHSERRQYYGETDAAVRAKVLAAQRAGLVAIVCIGETRGERDGGNARDTVGRQLAGSLPSTTEILTDHVVIAYEPVWAIGTGLTPTANDVGDMHGFIRQRLTSRYRDSGANVRILYGGSVRPSNAQELLAIVNVNGALVGGASRNPSEFIAIADVNR